MVVSQQTAEALTALDLTLALTNFFIRLDDLVAKALARFLQLAFIFMRKSFVFGNGNGVGAISWCHAISY